MIAFIKLWIIALILFENYFFMHYFDYLTRMVRMGSQQEGVVDLIDRKFYLTIFSMIRVAKAIKEETTYKSLIQYGVSLFYSPVFLVIYIWWMEL
jgi:hypothetical protein